MGVEGTPPGWPAEWSEALSDASLKAASSGTIFRRGQSYAASGAVEVTAEDILPEPALRAQVMGSEAYVTEVWIEDDAVAGACDCPNAEDGYFCKHQVALALVWRERLTSADAATDPVPHQRAHTLAKRARAVQNKRQALHDFLLGQESTALADKLLELADRDHDLSRELQQWRKLGEVQGDPAELKPIITDLLSPGRGFIAWNESAAYLGRAEAVLPLLRQARERDAGTTVKLCLHALGRAWDAMSRADDSDGAIGGLCTAIGAELVSALMAAGPRPAGFGETYLQLQLDDPIGSLDACAAETAMGALALTRYRQVLAQRWRAAKDAVLTLKAEQADKAARKGRAGRLDSTKESDLRLWTLERLHLVQLAQSGEVDAALAVLREDLSAPHGHSQVVRFLESHGRMQEAFAQAELAVTAFPGDWTAEGDLLRCLEREGKTREALALLRAQFERSPGVERYHRVLQAGAAAGAETEALRLALLEHLQGLEVAEFSAAQKTGLRSSWQRNLPAPKGPDVSLRAEILGTEGRWMDAFALVQPPARCRETVLERIALQLPEDHQGHAVRMLQRVFDLVMQRSSSPYQQALALVKKIGVRMAAAQRAEWLGQLRIEYKAKRNFVRDLPKR